MTSIFDLFGAAKKAAESKDASKLAELQTKDAQIAAIVSQVKPVLAEYKQKIQAQGIQANLIFRGSTGFELRIKLKWTYGVVKMENSFLYVYIESNPDHSNGYALDDYTQLAAAPRLPEGWSDVASFRAFLDRALQIFIERFGHSTRSSGNVGP